MLLQSYLIKEVFVILLRSLVVLGLQLDIIHDAAQTHLTG